MEALGVGSPWYPWSLWNLLLASEREAETGTVLVVVVVDVTDDIDSLWRRRRMRPELCLCLIKKNQR